MLPSVVTSPFFKRLPAFASRSNKQQQHAEVKGSAVPVHEELEREDGSMEQAGGVELVFQTPTNRGQGEDAIEVQLPYDALKERSSVISSSPRGDESFTSSPSSWRIKGQPSSKQGKVPQGEGDDDQTLNTLETQSVTNGSVTHESVTTMKYWALEKPGTREHNSTVATDDDESVPFNVLQNMLDHYNEMHDGDDASTLSGGSTRASQAQVGNLLLTQSATVDFEALQAMIFQYENECEEGVKPEDGMDLGGESGKTTHEEAVVRDTPLMVPPEDFAATSASARSNEITQALLFLRAGPSDSNTPEQLEQSLPADPVTKPPDFDIIEASSSNVEVSFAALQNFLLDQDDSSSLVSGDKAGGREGGESWRCSQTKEMEPAAVLEPMQADKESTPTAAAAEEAPIPDIVESSSSSVEVSFAALENFLHNQEDSSSFLSGDTSGDWEADKSWRNTQTKEFQPAAVLAGKEGPTPVATEVAAEEAPIPDIVESTSSSVEVSFEALQNFLFDQEDGSSLLSGTNAGGREADESWKSAQGKEVSEPLRGEKEEPTLALASVASKEAPIPDIVESTSSSVEVSFEALQSFLLDQDDRISLVRGNKAEDMEADESRKEANTIGEQEEDFQEAASTNKETEASWKQTPLHIETHTLEAKDCPGSGVAIPSPSRSTGMEKAFHDFHIMLVDAETEERCSSSASEDEKQKQVEPNGAGIVGDEPHSAQEETVQFQGEEDGILLDHTTSYNLASINANNFNALETIHEHPVQDNEDAASEHSGPSSVVYVSSCSTKESMECTASDIQSLIRHAVSSGSGQLLLSDSEDDEDSFQGLQVIVRNGSVDSVEGLQVLSPIPGPASKVELEFETEASSQRNTQSVQIAEGGFCQRFQDASVESKKEDEDMVVEAASCEVQPLQSMDIATVESLNPLHVVTPNVDRTSLAELVLTGPFSTEAAASINMDKDLFGKQSVPCLVSPAMSQVKLLGKDAPSITLEEKRENEESQALATIMAEEQVNADHCVNDEDDMQSIDFMELQAMIAQYELGLSSEDEEESEAPADSQQEIMLDSTKKQSTGEETSCPDSKGVKSNLDHTLDFSTVSEQVVTTKKEKVEENGCNNSEAVSRDKFRNINTCRAFKIFEAPKMPSPAPSGCIGGNKQSTEPVRRPTTEAASTVAAKFGVTLRKTKPFGVALRKTKLGDEANSNVAAVSPRKKPNQLLVRELNHIQTKREDETRSNILAVSPRNLLRNNVQAVSPRKERSQLLVRELKHIQSNGPNMFESMEGKIQAWQHQEAKFQEDIKKKHLSLRKFSSANRKQGEHYDDNSAAPVNGEETLLVWGNHPNRSKSRRETDLIRELQFVHSKTEGGDITDSLDHKVKSWQKEESMREVVKKQSKSSNPSKLDNLTGDDNKVKPRGSTNTNSDNTLSTRSVTELGSGSLIAPSEEQNTLFGSQPWSTRGELAIDTTPGPLNHDKANLMTSPISRISILVTPKRNTVQEKDAWTVEVTIHSNDNGGWEGYKEMVEPFELVVDEEEDDCGYVGHGVSDNVSVCSELTTFTVVSEKPAAPTTISPTLSTDSTESSATTEVGKSLLQLVLLSRKKLKKVAVRPAFCEIPSAAGVKESVDHCMGKSTPTPRSRIDNSDCILDYDWEELDDRDDVENVCSSPESTFRIKQEQLETAQSLPVPPHTPETYGGERIGQADGFYDSVSISFLADSIGDHVIGQVVEEAMRILRSGGILNVLDMGGAAIQRIREHPKYSFLVFSKATATDQERHETNTLSILEKSGLQNRFDANDPRLVHWTAVKQERPIKVESQAQLVEELTFLQVPAAALASMQ